MSGLFYLYLALNIFVVREEENHKLMKKKKISNRRLNKHLIDKGERASEKP